MIPPSDIAIGVCVLAWICSFLAPVVVPGIRLDSTVNLVLMALVGGLVALRQRKEGCPR